MPRQIINCAELQPDQGGLPFSPVAIALGQQCIEPAGPGHIISLADSLHDFKFGHKDAHHKGIVERPVAQTISLGQISHPVIERHCYSRAWSQKHFAPDHSSHLQQYHVHIQLYRGRAATLVFRYIVGVWSFHQAISRPPKKAGHVLWTGSCEVVAICASPRERIYVTCKSAACTVSSACSMQPCTCCSDVAVWQLMVTLSFGGTCM